MVILAGGGSGDGGAAADCGSATGAARRARERKRRSEGRKIQWLVGGLQAAESHHTRLASGAASCKLREGHEALQAKLAHLLARIEDIQAQVTELAHLVTGTRADKDIDPGVAKQEQGDEPHVEEMTKQVEAKDEIHTASQSSTYIKVEPAEPLEVHGGQGRHCFIAEGTASTTPVAEVRDRPAVHHDPLRGNAQGDSAGEHPDRPDQPQAQAEPRRGDGLGGEHLSRQPGHLEHKLQAIQLEIEQILENYEVPPKAVKLKLSHLLANEARLQNNIDKLRE